MTIEKVETMYKKLEECLEKRFIELRNPNQSFNMIFKGYDRELSICTFVDYCGNSKLASIEFVLGYLEGIETIKRENGIL